MAPQLQRLAAVLLLVLGLSAPITGEVATIDVCGMDCASTHSDPNFRACLRAIRHSPATGLNTSQVVFPEDAAYEHARRVWNSRFQPYPAAVFFAYGTADVSAAVQCAYNWGVKVSPSSGRQSFEGAAILDGYLTIDVSNITQTTVSPNNKTMKVGAGNSGSMVQYAVAASGIEGAAVPSGYCSFVGIAGWTLGGGFGLLGRYLGLGCDQVVKLTMVLYNGTVVQATADKNADLLAASCGAGGGTFGIVTFFEFKINILPNKGNLVEIEIQYAPNINTTVQALTNFQKWLPTADKRFGFVYGIDTRFSLKGVFFGTLEQAAAKLVAAGVLDGLDAAFVQDASSSDVADYFPYGLRLKWKPAYANIVAEGILGWTPAAWMGFPTPWADAPFTGAPDQLEFLLAMMSGNVRVVGGQAYNTWQTAQSRLIGLLPKKAWKAIAKFAMQVAEECASSNGTDVSCALGISGHVLGGAYADRPANATAFYHRDKYFVLDATLGLPTALVQTLTPEMVARAIDLPNQFLRVLKPFLGDTEAGYINYLLPAFEDWQRGYFGKNYVQLQRVKAKYDPLDVFGKPYTVRGLNPSKKTGD